MFSLSIPVLPWHFPLLYLAQLSKNLFLYNFATHGKGDLSKLNTEDIYNQWENSDEFHGFCYLWFQVFDYLLQARSYILIRNYYICLF